jgi:5-methylcytosine-specific restriction endonuclease McrBC regulatory subunit McrC
MTAHTRKTHEELILYEHSILPDVHLTAEQARTLAHFKIDTLAEGKLSLKRVLEVSPGSRPGRYMVRANSIVGSATIGGTKVNVLPKVGVGKTTRMLAYGIGLARWLPELAPFDEVAVSLTELLVPTFLDAVGELVARGIVEDYVETCESGVQPRGRLDFQGLARTGLALPLDYTYDHFTADGVWNQLVVRALHEVRDLRNLSANHHSEARNLLTAFGDLEFEPAPRMYSGEHLGERFEHYQSSLVLASLILQGLSLEAAGNTRYGRGILFDMNRVFEAFAKALISRMCPTGTYVDVQGKRYALHLDNAKRERLRPDFSLWRRGVCQLMGDIKYKVLDDSTGPRRSDLYQIIAYSAAARTQRALLLYAGAISDSDIKVVTPAVRIEICGLDLSKNIPDLETRVEDILRRS